MADLTDLPMVSVRLLVYNQRPFISKALESVLNQKTDFRYEICIGEDGSTDGTREICIEYAEKFSDRINLILRSRQDNRCTYSCSRICNFVETLKACRGKYIALLDGDDYWNDPLKLQKQVDFLESNPNYVITYHNAKTIDEKGSLILYHGRDMDDVIRPSSRADFSGEELKIGDQTIGTLTACFRNVFRDVTLPEEFKLVFNGDTALFSFLGDFGCGKYMGDEIEPAMNRIHTGGVWSLKERHEQLSMLAKTYHQMLKYYQRVEDDQMAYHYREKEFNILKAWLCEVVKSVKNRELIMVYARYCQICLRHFVGAIRLNGKVVLRLLFGVRI